MRVPRALPAALGVVLLAAAPAAARSHGQRSGGNSRGSHGRAAHEHGRAGHEHGRAAHEHGRAGQPQVIAVSPGEGPSAGGTEVTISGRNLVPGGRSCSLVEELTSGKLAHDDFGPQLSGCAATIVYFGTEPGLVAFASQDTIDVFSPPHLPGPVPVRVLTPAGMSHAQDRSAQFRYAGMPSARGSVAPVVSGVSPADGPGSGFIPVTISGEHLLPAGVQACLACAHVVARFDARAVPVLEGTPNKLLVAAPPHPPGSVDVTVIVEATESATSPADRFTYTSTGHKHEHERGREHAQEHGRGRGQEHGSGHGHGHRHRGRAHGHR
jgi:hypothetical protein